MWERVGDGERKGSFDIGAPCAGSVNPRSAPDPQGSEVRGLPYTIERFEDGSDVAYFSSQLPYEKGASNCWLLVTSPPPPRADLRTHYHAVPRACTCQSLYPFTGPQGASELVNNHNIPIASDSRLQLATCAGGRGGRAEETQKGDHRSLRLAHRPHATAGNLHVYTLCNAPSVYHLSFQVSPAYLASTRCHH